MPATHGLLHDLRTGQGARRRASAPRLGGQDPHGGDADGGLSAVSAACRRGSEPAHLLAVARPPRDHVGAPAARVEAGDGAARDRVEHVSHVALRVDRRGLGAQRLRGPAVRRGADARAAAGRARAGRVRSAGRQQRAERSDGARRGRVGPCGFTDDCKRRGAAAVQEPRAARVLFAVPLRVRRRVLDRGRRGRAQAVRRAAARVCAAHGVGLRPLGRNGARRRRRRESHLVRRLGGRLPAAAVQLRRRAAQPDARGVGIARDARRRTTERGRATRATH